MSEQASIKYNNESEELNVEGFTTEDPDIVNYFSDMEPNRRPEKLETALRVGVLALRSSETVEDVDYVEKRFTDLQQTFNEQVDDLLGEDGTVPEYVDEHFGDDGKLVSEVFDPEDEDTPLGRLRRTINKEMEQLRKDLEVAEAEAEMVESTRLKGEQFEEDLYELLSNIATVTGDRVEQTGEKQGLLGQSKKGDFVIDLGDLPGKVVVEAKDTYYSQPQIEEEMEKAIRNRGATYGLFVARSIDNVPSHVGWFNEYNQNQLVVVLSDGEEERRAQELLRVGYKWARMRVLEAEAPSGDEFDAGTVQEEIAAAERTLNSFQNIKKRCTSIEKEADAIRDDVVEIQNDLEANLDTISDELANVQSAPTGD